MAKLVSKTYGDALFALAVEEHMVDQLYEEAQAVAQILRENTELTRLMNHPKIEKEEKVRLIEDIFKGRIGDELVGLLRMLVQKGHYKETDQVFTYFIWFQCLRRMLFWRRRFRYHNTSLHEI